MKIAVVGCGALGSYYGASLCREGQEVHFLLRSDYDVVRHHGVAVHSPQGDFTVRPHCAKDPAEIGPADLVLIGLKTTANDQFPRLLPPLVGPHTAVVTLQNGLGNEEALARLFPVEQILGGLCFVCLNRTAPGVIHHLAHGRIVLGEFRRPPGQRTHALAALLRRASVPCDVTENLAAAHWEKLVWNIPFNGLGVAGAAGYDAVLRGALPPGATLGACLPTDVLLGDARWEALVRALMGEIITAARTLGFALEDSLAEENIQRTKMMGAYEASTLVDFARGQSLELDSVFLEPLRQARGVGVATRHLEALCGVLRDLAAVVTRTD